MTMALTLHSVAPPSLVNFALAPPLTLQSHSHRTPISMLERQQAFEERFGGAADTQLGELVNGVPQGMAKNVQRNMFRLI